MGGRRPTRRGRRGSARFARSDAGVGIANGADARASVGRQGRQPRWDPRRGGLGPADVARRRRGSPSASRPSRAPCLSRPRPAPTPPASSRGWSGSAARWRSSPTNRGCTTVPGVTRRGPAPPRDRHVRAHGSRPGGRGGVHARGGSSPCGWGTISAPTTASPARSLPTPCRGTRTRATRAWMPVPQSCRWPSAHDSGHHVIPAPREVCRPPSNSAPADERRLQSSGRALRDGWPAYATAASRSDTKGGRPDRRASGSVVVDLVSGRFA